MRLPGFPTIVLALCLVAHAGSGPKPPSQASWPQDIASVFSKTTSPDDPGLAVLVKQKGQILFEQGNGVRELRAHTKVDSSTNFRLASFTKQFTATAVLLLIHDGKLHYEDHLSDVFPDFPAYGKAITIRNLLNHTSGLPDYEEIMDTLEASGGPRWSPEHQIQDAEVLSLLKQQSAGKFAPGTSWSYSNSGYVVLGLVIAKVSGMPYRDFLQKRIFAPAGMKHSIVYEKGVNEIADRAYGHSKKDNVFVETDQSATSATLGDGGIYSNLRDLSKWDDALQHHLLLGEKEMAPALKPAKLADGAQTFWPPRPNEDNLAPGKPVSYGFGWFLDPYQSHPRMWHAGGTMGFRSVIQRFTSDGLTIVVLANRTDLDPTALSEKFADVIISGPSQ